MNENAQNIFIKKENSSKNDDVVLLVEKKLSFFKDVIQKTILYVQKNKTLDILGVSDIIACIDKLTDLRSVATNIFIDFAILIGITYCALLRNLYN